MLFSLGTNLTGHEGRTQRQLCSGQAERFTSQLFRDAHDFVEHLAGLDFGHVVLGVALTVTHTHFCGLGRDWLVREHADPDTTATLDVTRDRAASRFEDRKSTRLNSSHLVISYAVFCLKKKKTT